MQLGVATIGLGIMGNRMLGFLSRNGGFRLVNAWDPSQPACDSVATDYPEVRIASDADDAIFDEAVDVVYIACPPSAHHRYAMLAAEAGKTVFCEKPLGVGVPQSEELVKVSVERGITNAVNFPFAAVPTVDFIESEINKSALGEIHGVDVRLHFAQWPRQWQEAASWLAYRAEGGFVREVGSHFVFLAEKLFGRAQLISSSVTYPADGQACETHFLARLDCSGVAISMAGGAGGVGPDTVDFIIRGSKKSVMLADWGEISTTTGGDWQRETIYKTDQRGENNSRFFDDFKNLVAGHPNTMATFEDALSVQRIVESILAG